MESVHGESEVARPAPRTTAKAAREGGPPAWEGVRAARTAASAAASARAPLVAHVPERLCSVSLYRERDAAYRVRGISQAVCSLASRQTPRMSELSAHRSTVMSRTETEHVA